MPDLTRAEIFGNRPYPVADVLARQVKRRAIRFDPAQGYVNVRVFSIEMWDGNPLQPRAQIILHPAHELACQLVQVDSFAEFGRYDHFPEPRVASFLPPIENLRQRHAFDLIAKNADNGALPHALTGDVAAVRSPLAGDFVW
jgi:hypothetical protein